MIYHCDENEKIFMKIYSDCFKFIVRISHNETPNNGGSHYFVMVTLFNNANNYNHEFVNTLQIK